MVIGLHVSDELLKLAEEGFGRYIDKTEMENDKIDTRGFIPKKIQWHIHAGPWSLVNCSGGKRL